MKNHISVHTNHNNNNNNNNTLYYIYLLFYYLFIEFLVCFYVVMFLNAFAAILILPFTELN